MKSIIKKTTTVVMSSLAVLSIQPNLAHSETLANESKATSSLYQKSSASHYWTAERLKHAETVPMLTEPEYDTETSSYLEESTAEFFDVFNDEPQIESQSQAGQAPNAAGQPDYQHQVFEAEEIPTRKNEAVEDSPSISVQSAGTSKAFFTSSGLIPGSARTHYPYRTIGKLFFTAADGRDMACSASVVSPRVILTAGHCLHSGNGNNSGWSSNFLFIPAFENGNAPFSQWSWSYAWANPDWFYGGGTVPNAGDVGLLVLNDQTLPGSDQPTRIGDQIGWLGWKTNALSKNHVHMLGYPSNFDQGLKMHQVASQTHKTKDSVVEYGSDMQPGSSGGPWIENLGSGNHVVGVTSYGYDDPAVKLQGSSKLNDDFVNGWKQVCARQENNCN